MPTPRKVEISFADYDRLRNVDNGGICIACGAIVDFGIEPDAENYPCEECEKNQVFGIEQALLLGYLELKED